MTEPIFMQPKEKYSRGLLFLVCTGLFLVALANRAMLVSLPTLTQYFHTSVAVIQWALLAFDLSVIGLVLTLGKLGDVFGRKYFYVWGFLTFSGGSLLCGLSEGAGQLIFFRIIQGIGAAMIIAHGRAIVVAAVPTAERGKALGMTSMAFHVGFVTGPTLGGFLIDSVGWRWIFFLNLPIGIAIAALAWKVLAQPVKAQGDTKVDIAGASLLFITTSSLVYAMNQLPVVGFTHPMVLSCLVIFVAALFLFIRTELRAETPILNLSLFRNRIFSASNLTLFVITFTQSSVGLLMVFYLQSLRGYSASQMGWIIIANSLVVIVCSPLAGKLSDRLGSRLLCTVGAILMILGQVMIANFTLESTLFEMIAPLILGGLGWAAFNSPNQSAMMGAVRRDQAGAASGMNVTTARIGGTVGLAISGAIFTYGLSSGGLTPEQISSPLAWSHSPEVFLKSFQYTIHAMNVIGVLAIIFSALRGASTQTGPAAKAEG